MYETCPVCGLMENPLVIHGPAPQFCEGRCEGIVHYETGAREHQIFLDALRKISTQDYRGNRSTEMEIAYRALKETGYA